MISAVKGVNELVVLCKKHGIKHVVVSPGSRNAPLSITFEHTNDLSTYVVVDERSAAFFALGISLATDSPVAIVCTSGSAALNYAPAISEAFYQKIPLIVITADRPQEWVNQGDGQTIMQHSVYGNHVLNSVTLPVIENDDTAWLYNRLINESLILANGKIKGPVHINVPFKEPLYLTIGESGHEPRFIEKIQSDDLLNEHAIESIASIINSSKKVLLLIGQTQPDTDLNELVARLFSFNNCIVLSETTSNLYGKNVVSTIDRVIDGFSPLDKINFAPDVLITAGDAIVSKKVKGWLRNNKPKEHIHIGHEHSVIDTYMCLTKTADVSIKHFLMQALKYLKNVESDFCELWMSRSQKMLEKHNFFMLKLDWSDLKAFEIITNNLPACNLHLGNSSPIRYIQLFDIHKKVKYYSNRGTSGIDGSTSTAVGFSNVDHGLNVLITGDISFYYDSNALWNNYLNGNLKIILINNGGGNIFRIIEGPTDEALTQKYFEAKQHYTAQHICSQFKVDYFKANNEIELNAVIGEFLKPGNKAGLLEIFTDNLNSPQVLKNYFAHLKN